jgi:hypothetical protein
LAETYNHESFAVGYLKEADPQGWAEGRAERARMLVTAYHRLLMFLAALSVVALPRRRGATRTVLVSQGVLLALLAATFAYVSASVAHSFYLFALLAPLIALAQLPGRPHQGAAGRWMIAFWAVTSLTHAVFFGEDRYHLVVTPVLCVLADGALRRGPEQRQGMETAGTHQSAYK